MSRLDQNASMLVTTNCYGTSYKRYGRRVTPSAVTRLGTPSLEKKKNPTLSFPFRAARAEAGNEQEVVRLVETLARGSVAESTQKKTTGEMRKIWVEERRLQGKGPWLHELGDTDQVLEEVLEFMASRCSCITISSRLSGGIGPRSNTTTRCVQDGNCPPCIV